MHPREPGRQETEKLPVLGKEKNPRMERIRKISQKLHQKSGFSLSELLVTALLMGLVTTAVAGASSAVLRVYRDVTLRADAQTLLSTADSAMKRDLYTAAGPIKQENGEISFTCEDVGEQVTYSNDKDQDQKKILRTTGSGNRQPLVADPTRTQGLSLTLDNFTAEQDSNSRVWVFHYTLTVSKENFSETQNFTVRSMISE